MVGPGGLIDVQVNGAGGFDLTGEPEAVWPVGAILAGFGVGAFVPTLVSPAYEVVDRALAALAAGPPPGYAGATPLGWHVEGPFLNPARAGAHDPSALKTPDRGAARGWSRDAGVRMVTIAPELPGALDLVTELLARGVVVSAGHSDATIEQARAGFDAGITAVTHLFNAMPRLDHRAPGLVGAALADERISIGLIVDGVHLHPTVVDLVWRICGPDRLVDVDVEAGTARLEDGTLAGCIVPVRDSVANLAAAANVPVEVARRAATVNPARLLGLGLGLGLE
jgi:N-acetylglucosamine-6-phosphate deacetylase